MRRSILVTLVVASLTTGCGATPPAETSRDPASRTEKTTEATKPPEDPAAARRAELEAQVDRAIATLDQDAELAQLFVIGVHLDELPTADPLVRDHQVGGIFLHGRSSAPAAELAETTARWNSLATGPAPWIAADQEGGKVQTLSGPGFDKLPTAWEQAQLPPDQLAAVADGLGGSLASAGINLNLAPVADVVPAGTEHVNEPIGAFRRHYGSTAATMTPAVRTVLDGMAAHGVTATLKHFPGLGYVRDNTDTTPTVRDTVIGPDHEQVVAFGQLAQAPAAPFVMMSSATYDLIDPGNQAAFSHAMVTGLLRGRLGFTGVVISDDFGAADAVEGLPPGQRAVRFLEAGGTLVLTVEPDVLPEMLAGVRERAASDPQFARAVDAAVRTALLAKARAGLLPN